MIISLLLAVFLFPTSGHALEARWLGVSGILLKDDQTTLLIDPVFTKPTLTHWLTNSSFKSDEIKVKKEIELNAIDKVDGVFISHCHFDHASDVAYLSKLFKAPVHGGESLKKIVHHLDPMSPFVDAKNGSEFQIGKFKIKMYTRPHPAIIRSIDWHFLGGLIEKFDGNFYDYREGEVWMFIIEHPEGVSIFDQSSILFDESKKYVGKVTNYFLGIANPVNKQTLVGDNISILKPKRVIGIHHDFFFLDSEDLSKRLLPTVDLEHLTTEIKKLDYPVELIIPEKSKIIRLD